MPVTRTHLFVDRASLTINIPQSNKESLDSALHGMAIEEIILPVTNMYSELLKSYRRAYIFPLCNERQLSIQIWPRGSNENSRIEELEGRGQRKHLRIEWNPQPEPLNGTLELHQALALLDELIPAFCIERLWGANVTRMDFSFDVLGLSLDKVDVFSRLGRINSERYRFGQRGYLNQVRLGLYGASRELLVYDKLLEQKSRQIGLSTSLPELTRRPLLRRQRARTRFELRCRNLGPLGHLDTIPNPFDRYTVRSFEYQDCPNDLLFYFFIDSCRFRGIQASLSRFSDRAQRDKFRKRVQMLDPPSWWDPAQLWSERTEAIRRAFGLAAP